MQIEDCFCIGYITKTRGLRGEIQIFFEYAKPQGLPLQTLFIEIEGKLIPYFSNTYKLQTNNAGYFYLDGLNTIEEAQKLVKKRVYLPSFLKPPVHMEDSIEGFKVYDHHYGALGNITKIENYPQQRMAFVFYRSQEVMFPLNEEFVKSINKAENTIHVDLPDGLIDVFLSAT